MGCWRNPFAAGLADRSSLPASMKERQFLLWVLLLAYLVGRVLQLFPEEVPGLVIAGLHVVPPILFAVIHGGRMYGLGRH